MNIFYKILDLKKIIFNNCLYGFITYSKKINLIDFYQSLKFIFFENEYIINSLENKFSKIIGSGYSVSYSAGRMGLFELLKVLNLKKGDEVIINAGTCAVMINALLDFGVNPVYSDVDPFTFGSCPVQIKKCTTKKTKMIIAQHSFGIPCNIHEINDFAKLNNIFLLEDCALAVDSELNNTKLGNFGDAALFSFDHTKPINGFIGGIIYTRNKNLYSNLKESSLFIYRLPKIKQIIMLLRHTFEQLFISPKNYRFIKLSNVSLGVFNLIGIPSPFMNENSGLNNHNCSYPYPSKMPTFVANLLIKNLNTWGDLKEKRKSNLEKIINELRKLNLSNYISNEYFKQTNNIVPLRLVLFNENSKLNLKNLFNDFISIDEVWFQQPIIATNIPLSSYGLNLKECKKSVMIGKKVINIPLDLNDKYLNILIEKIKYSINKKI